MSARPLLAGLVLALPLAAVSQAASAGEGSPGASPSPRPPFVVLRQLAQPTAPVTVDSGRAPEVVLLVGGFGSDNGDDAFGELTASLVSNGLVVRRFGTDDSYPYDTSGSIDESADTLCDAVRAAAREYAAVSIVAHSMGGVVVDRAMSRCMASGDVATYVAWSSPHAGSSVAQRGQLALALAGDARPELASLLSRLGPNLDTAAGRDLASAPGRTPRPDPDVVRLDLREATDLTVPSRDARDGGVPQRTLLGSVEGHGGILTDDRAIELTERTILERRVPPDDRGALLRRASDAVAGVVDLLGGRLLEALFLIAAIAGLTLRARRFLIDPMLQPIRKRWWRYLPWSG